MDSSLNDIFNAIIVEDFPSSSQSSDAVVQDLTCSTELNSSIPRGLTMPADASFQPSARFSTSWSSNIFPQYLYGYQVSAGSYDTPALTGLYETVPGLDVSAKTNQSFDLAQVTRATAQQAQLGTPYTRSRVKASNATGRAQRRGPIKRVKRIITNHFTADINTSPSTTTDISPSTSIRTSASLIASTSFTTTPSTPTANRLTHKPSTHPKKSPASLNPINKLIYDLIVHHDHSWSEVATHLNTHKLWKNATVAMVYGRFTRNADECAKMEGRKGFVMQDYIHRNYRKDGRVCKRRAPVSMSKCEGAAAGKEKEPGRRVKELLDAEDEDGVLLEIWEKAELEMREAVAREMSRMTGREWGAEECLNRVTDIIAAGDSDTI